MTNSFQLFDLLFKSLICKQCSEGRVRLSFPTQVSLVYYLPCYRVIIFKLVHLGKLDRYQASIVEQVMSIEVRNFVTASHIRLYLVSILRCQVVIYSITSSLLW